MKKQGSLFEPIKEEEIVSDFSLEANKAHQEAALKNFFSKANFNHGASAQKEARPYPQMAMSHANG